MSQGKAKANPRHKETRQRSWNKAQVEKPRRNAEDRARAKANDEIRSRGSLETREACARSGSDTFDHWLTPHEQQELKRRVKRDDLRARNLLPPIGTTRAAWEKTRSKTASTTERNPA